MAQLLFFLLQDLREKMCFEAKLFSTEKAKKKSQGQYRKTSVCVTRLTLKEKDVHWSPWNISSPPSLCVLLKKQNKWWERNWEAIVQLPERPRESSPWDENRKETKEERGSTRKPSVPSCRQLLAVCLSARAWGMMNSGHQSSLHNTFQRHRMICPAGCWA